MQYLLPVEDAVAVSRELARRTGLPCWQCSISASSADTGVIRIARAMTGRRRILLFDGAFSDARGAFMANRGVWEAIVSAGPQVGHYRTDTDIDTHLSVAAGVLAAVRDGRAARIPVAAGARFV